MTSDPLIPTKPRLWRRFLALKTLLVSFSFLGLLASNLASLVSASAHDQMHNALWTVLSIGGQTMADRALAESPKRKIDRVVKVTMAELDAKHRHLVASHELQGRELEASRVKSQKLAQQLDVNGKQAKATLVAVHQRLAKGVTRNLAALPGESIPYLGLGVTLAVTSLDIYDACQTMKDFNTLLKMMEQGKESEELCGQKVPSIDQVLATAKTEWRTSVQRVAEESKAFKVAAPDVRLPTRDEVAKVSCTSLALPYLCPKK